MNQVSGTAAPSATGTAVNPLDGTRIAYATGGTGDPLLLVHGSALSKAIWRGFGYLKELQQRHRVITVDLRGHGRSDKPQRPDDYAMELVVADLLAVLDATGTPATHYFGYSFGARAGYALAATHPTRLRSFISAGGSYRVGEGVIGDLFFPQWEDALATAGMPGFVAGWEQWQGRPLDPATRAAFLVNDAAALLAYFRRTEAEAGLEEDVVARITTPTLLLAGSRDAPRLADSRRAAELMPAARLVVLPGRSHASTLFPAAEVLTAVTPFLSGQAGPARER
jgi:pimeloyl-ACP methyl ester carboxylesterase